MSQWVEVPATKHWDPHSGKKRMNSFKLCVCLKNRITSRIDDGGVGFRLASPLCLNFRSLQVLESPVLIQHRYRLTVHYLKPGNPGGLYLGKLFS